MIKIHKEGRKIVAIITVFTFLCAVIATIFLISKPAILIVILLAVLFFALFILNFFRVPQRKMSFRKGIIYSPADGKIVAIEQTYEDEFLHEKRIQVSIFMSVWDVHINYAPIKGKVIYYKYHPGKFLIARHPKSSELNERATIVMESENKTRILIRQIAGIVARRIISYARLDKIFRPGDELGFIRFGSRVDVFLPEHSKILVNLNDQVCGSKTPLALLSNT